MPELPDVEAFRGVLASCAQGAVIRRVDVYDSGVLHGVSARRLRTELTGRAFAAPERHGKWLLAPTVRGSEAALETALESASEGAREGPELLVHFGMTGELVCEDAGAGLHRHDRVVFTVEGGGAEGDGDGDGGSDRGRDRGRDRGGGGGGSGGARELRYRDQRKLKGLWLVDAGGADRMLAEQGPDAAEVGRTGFDELLAGRRGGLKSALTDQSVIAGLGNLLADEILWRARLHPSEAVSGLSQEERGRLYAQVRGTVRASVRAGRVPGRDSWLTGHRDARDAHCPRCGTALRRTRVAGRTTVWCPHCQRR
ncbi:DNA-formamidopyrimidine glycosylase family protein [Streptomyces sulfonofaciens]|nr:DNA-formamidopyrimidine glycosylase family protein [Streptomyces sulfonofaciens]